MVLQWRHSFSIIILKFSCTQWRVCCVIPGKIMRIWLLPLLAGMLHAAVIRGTVVENQTGHPLAHASLLLEPVPGSTGKRMTVHTDRYGFFEFGGAEPGMYILQVTRVPFLTGVLRPEALEFGGDAAYGDGIRSFIRNDSHAALRGDLRHVVDETTSGSRSFKWRLTAIPSPCR